MTINDLLEAGIILQGLGRVYSMSGPSEAHPYGEEQMLFEATSSLLDLRMQAEEAWADREIAYMYPLLWNGMPYSQLAIEVK